MDSRAYLYNCLQFRWRSAVSISFHLPLWMFLIHCFHMLTTFPTPTLILSVETSIYMTDINWDSLTSASSSLDYDSFCEAIFINSLHQLIKEPTQIRGNILDLVLTSSPELIDNLCVHKHTYSSDHFLISASVTTNTYAVHNSYSKVERSSLTENLDYKKADWKGLYHYLLDVDFEQCYFSMEVDTVWHTIRSIILDGCSIIFPADKNQPNNTLSGIPLA